MALGLIVWAVGAGAGCTVRSRWHLDSSSRGPGLQQLKAAVRVQGFKFFYEALDSGLGG